MITSSRTLWPLVGLAAVSLTVTACSSPASTADESTPARVERLGDRLVVLWE